MRLRRIPRSVLQTLAVAVLVGGVVLLVAELRGDQYQGRVGLLASPVPDADHDGSAPQYGQVVSLALPALVELARSPSVLQAAAGSSGHSPDELAEHISVELVPASGLARVSVFAGTAEQAGAAASALAAAMIDADLLAPVGRLRVLDERSDVTRVSPDRQLGFGLALVAAAATAVAVATVRHLMAARGRADEEAARAALAAAGVHPAVAVVRAGDPALVERLSVLCEAAARPVRVVAAAMDLHGRAKKLSRQLPACEARQPEGSAVIALAHGGRARQGELSSAVGVLPAGAVLVAVVLA